MSFLEQKKRILERQQEIERQKQQHKTYYGSSYSQKPQFNRPQSAAPPQVQPQQQFSSYPPAIYPNSRYSFNQWSGSTETEIEQFIRVTSCMLSFISPI